MDTTPEELKLINSDKAKEEFASRIRQQEEHLENTFGPVRKAEAELAAHNVNFALLNWIMTLHNFGHLKGMDYLNAVNKMFMVHMGSFEKKVKLMEGAMGSEKLKSLGIDPELLYPTEIATKGLEKVQEAARLRARAGKYLKLEKPKKIIME